VSAEPLTTARAAELVGWAPLRVGSPRDLTAKGAPASSFVWDAEQMPRTSAMDRGLSSKQRWHLALHESGHAVGAMILVRRVPHPISIEYDGFSAGRARTGTFIVPGIPLAVVEREIQLLLAGLAAEEVIGKVSDPLVVAAIGQADLPGSDIHSVLAWLDVGGVEKRLQSRRVDALYQRTCRLMGFKAVRKAVKLLADRLMANGTIGDSGSEQVLQADFDVLERAERLVAEFRRRRPVIGMLSLGR